MRTTVSIVQVGFRSDEDLADPEALLERYMTLTGWSEAVLEAGAARVAVVHGFRRDARMTRRGIEYVFCTSGIGAAAARLKPDVVHVNGLNAPGRTWRLRRSLPPSTALLVQDHGGGGAPVPRPSVSSRLRYSLRLYTMRAADGFIFTSAAQAIPWRRAGLIRPSQAVYEVIESSTLLRPLGTEAARSESGVDGAPAVLWVGRLNANKDPLTVLDGFERLLRSHPQAALTLVYGESQGLALVEQRVRSSPTLRSRVRLAGRVPHERLAASYSAADIFVLGSHHEGSGYAAIEACACGATPVITDIPSFRAITAGGAVGRLWTPGDGADCARALVAATAHISPAERSRVIDHFWRRLSWQSIGRSALIAYEAAWKTRSAALGPRVSA